MASSRSFGFSVPSLPKEEYEFVNQVRDQYGVTQRDVIIAALRALRHLARLDRTVVDDLLILRKKPDALQTHQATTGKAHKVEPTLP